jgi:hypothetical protein
LSDLVQFVVNLNANLAGSQRAQLIVESNSID